MTRTRSGFIVFWIAMATALPNSAQEPATPVVSPSRPLLDAIRDDLVELRFEQALAAIEALLGQPELREAERGEALVLRSQTHVAFGDLEAAEEDWKLILRMRPGYLPDSSLTPSKAMARFEKIRKTLVGSLALTLDPPDARVVVDGLEVGSGPEQPIPLLAGEHVLEAELEGFDAQRRRFSVEADSAATLDVRLVPNARTLIVLTEPEGVEVALDGTWVGVTERAPRARGSARAPAELRIENLALGEHRIELSKACFRTERKREMLTVDLVQRTPRVLSVVRLAPVSATLVLRGGPSGSEVLIAGKPSGRLPRKAIELCPGTHELELRRGGRAIWRSTVRLAEGAERIVEVEARPNAAIVAAAGWPPVLSSLEGRFNRIAELSAPRGADLSTPVGWTRVELPADTDIAFARTSASRRSGRATEWYVYSPILEQVSRVDEPPRQGGRPRWNGAAWGLHTADSHLGGPAVVVQVVAGGPAAAAGLAPGDRITGVGGVDIDGAAQLRKILGVASTTAPIELLWIDGGSAERRRGEMHGRRSVRLSRATPQSMDAALRAAWAVVDAIADEQEAPAALANLALLQSGLGRHEAAAATWQRVVLAERAGIGEGTAQYYLGCELQALGRDAQAVEQFEATAASAATVEDDDGPAVAPAARDRLADLGVAPGGPG